MAFSRRKEGNPYLTGYIVHSKKRCYKPICQCMTGELLHSFFQIKYYDYTDGKRRQRSLYLPKYRVAEVQKMLSEAKGLDFLLYHKDDQKKLTLALQNPKLRGNQFLIPAYEAFGTAKFASHLLAYVDRKNQTDTKKGVI